MLLCGPSMRVVKNRWMFAAIIAFAVFIAATRFTHVPSAPSFVSADEFVKAIADHRSSLVDLYFAENLNPNARATQDRTLLLAATLQQDQDLVRRLLDAGACVDLADETGLTPLMAAAMQGNIDLLREFMGRVTSVDAPDRSHRTALHYAIAAQKRDAVDFLLQFMPNLAPYGSDLLATALDAGDAKITGTILNHLPPLQQWNASTRRVLQEALAADNRDRIRLLLAKHAVPPTAEGKNVPMLAYAIASHDPQLLTTLLACGADANTVLPEKLDDDFVALLP